MVPCSLPQPDQLLAGPAITIENVYGQRRRRQQSRIQRRQRSQQPAQLSEQQRRWQAGPCICRQLPAEQGRQKHLQPASVQRLGQQGQPWRLWTRALWQLQRQRPYLGPQPRSQMLSLLVVLQSTLLHVLRLSPHQPAFTDISGRYRRSRTDLDSSSRA